MNIVSGILGLVWSILKVLGIFLIPLAVFLGLIFSITFLRFMYRIVIKKDKLPKMGSYKKRSIFKRLIIDFPKQFVIDRFNKEDYEFNEYGVHMVLGEQGSGKTTTVVFLLQKWKEMYPHLKIATNMGYKFEQARLRGYEGVVGRTNGKQGQAEVIDEIQTWFSSNNSRNFPVEMISEISQQRKQRKCIVGTAQVFSRIGKPLREQTHFVYLPMTLFGCLTLVRKSQAKYWNDEKQRFTRYTGFFFFVHNEKIRNSFDTYLKIENYKRVGYKSDIERKELIV